MIDDPPTRVESPRRLTFSLRTMFLIVSCAAIFLGGGRIAESAAERIVIGAHLVYFFLIYWFFLTRRPQWTANMIVALVLGWALIIAVTILPTVF
jgi:hypothetical protein